MQELWNNAIKFHQEREWEKCLDILEHLTTVSPNHVEGIRLKANVLEQLSRNQESIDCYRQALILAPNCFEINYELGRLLWKMNKHQDSLPLFEKAVQINSLSFQAWADLGVTHYVLRNADKAIECLVKSLEIKPDRGDTLASLAVVYAEKKSIEDAIFYFQKSLVLDPNNPQILCNYGALLSQNNNHEQAIAQYRKAIEIKPDLAHAYSNLGILLREAGNLKEGIEQCRKAIELNPNLAEAYSNLALLLKENGEVEEAIQLCSKALEIDPNNLNALNNLGNTLQDKNELESSIEIYQRLLNQDPNNAKALGNFANALQKHDDLEQAINSYKKALDIKPDYALAYNNLGNAYLRKGDVEAAITSYQKAIDNDPNYHEAKFHIAMAYLLKSDLEIGFRNYEYRWEMKEFLEKNGSPDFQEPKWNGEELFGKIVLIVNEQGIGDRIQFIRYASLIKSMGGRVLYECPKIFFRLFSTFKDIDILIPEGAPRPRFDYYIHLQSIPAIVGTNLSNIPCQIPYLFAPIDQKKSIVDTICSHSKDKLKIGIVWASSLTHKTSPRRSIPLSLLKDLFLFDQGQFFSLQKEMKEEDENVLKSLNIIDLRHELEDFADTATAIKHLNLIISVDTAVAHLAGAMGKEVWIMLPFVPDWRWMLDRDDSPWYPTAKLFRQLQPKYWHSVIKEIYSSITNYLPKSIELKEELKRSDRETQDLVLSLNQKNEGIKLAQQALAAYEKGDYQDAIKYSSQVLQIESSHPEILNVMGVSHYKLGNIEAGIEYLNQAVLLVPRHKDFHANLGLILDRANRIPEAIVHFKQAIEIKPTPEIHNNLGNAYQKIRDYNNAVEQYQLAINYGNKDPKHYFNLGNALKANNDLDGALECFTTAIELKPDYARAYDSIGLAYMAKDKLTEAIESYQKAIGFDPNNSSYHLHLGNAYAKKKEFALAQTELNHALQLNNNCLEAMRGLAGIALEHKQSEIAVKLLQRALEITPHCPDTRVNLAVALIQTELFNEAEILLNEALLIKSNYAEAYINLGVIANKRENFIEACAYFEKAIQYKPDFISAYLNYGLALAMQEKIEEAINTFRSVLNYQPDHPDAHMNIGIGLLSLGRIKEGWAEYEWRHNVQEYNSRRLRIHHPLWNGEPILDKTLLIYTEQGLGDCIQFSRFIPIVKKFVNKIIIECNQELLRELMKHISGVDEVYVIGEQLPHFDYHYPLMSLPHLLGIELSNIPHNLPHVNVAKDKINLPSNDTNKIKVGIVWTANLGNPTTGKRRTIPLELFQSILEIDGIQFYILQKESFDYEKSILEKYNDRVINLGHLLKDLTDTASLIQQLDLVISVDTMISHLAGSFNIPTWVILPFAPDWRWLLKREDSPWYNSLRLFRKFNQEDWQPVLQRVKQQLHLHQIFHTRLQDQKKYQAIIANQPNYGDAYNNLGVVELVLGNVSKAVEILRRSVELSPNLSEAKLNLGTALLYQGHFREGLNLYLLRWQVDGFSQHNQKISFNIPLWNGKDDISDNVLYVHPEQGFGDQIQFIRYLPLIKHKVKAIYYGCHKNLVKLFQELDFIDRLITDGEQFPLADYYIPLGDLLSLSKEIPPLSSYISPKTSSRWDEYFSNIDKPKIGIVWETISNHPTAYERSIGLPYFHQLLYHLDYKFYIIQPQVSESDQKLLEIHCKNLIDLSKEITDFQDTARIISYLDLVITIDSAVAHLAGAMGKKTWILLPHIFDWRWKYKWYKSVTLFCQPKHGDWQSVIDRVNESLSIFSGLEVELEVLINQASNAYQEGKIALAISILQQCINISPMRQDLSFTLGNILGQSGRLEEAIEIFGNIYQSNPSYPGLTESIAKSYFNLGNATNEKQEYDKAIKLYQKALQYNPKLVKAHTNLGIVYGKLGELDSSISHYKESIRLHPDHADVYNNFATTLLQHDRVEDAKENYQQALKINSDHAEAHSGLATIYRDRGDLSEAISHHSASITINPTYANARFNLAQTLLLDSRLTEGFKEYEWRFKSKQFLDQGFADPNFDRPLWDGSNLFGKRILILTEQGIGDQIQFIRYTKILKEMGAIGVIYCCPEPLLSLFQSIPWIDELVAPGGATPRFDCWVSLMSLPYLCQTDIHSIPNPVPYLNTSFDFNFKGRNRKSLVGICWASRSASPSAKRRSSSLEEFICFTPVSGIKFVSLQKEINETESRLLLEHNIENLVDELTDFHRTAKIIQNLDLVITVDTAVAHLSAAMGKPTWILLNFSPDWRWMTDREDSPWYPTVRLFRQKYFDSKNWDDVIEDVKNALLFTVSPLSSSKEFDKALGYYQSGNLNNCQSICEEILKNDRYSTKVNHLLGVIKVQKQMPFIALQYLYRALTYYPLEGGILHALGGTLVFLRKLDHALFYLHRSLQFDPQSIETWNNIGSAYGYLNLTDDSIYSYEQSISIRDSAEAQFGIALGLLKKGEYARGFKEYESRWQQSKFQTDNPLPNFIQPRWDGCSLEGKIILVCAEQGAGDQIQFWRFFRILKAKEAKKIIYVCPPSLVTLCRLLPDVDQIIENGETIPPFDYWTPLLSLPHVLGITLNNLPTAHRYLKAPLLPKEVDDLFKNSKKLRVGLVWACKRDHETFIDRSIPFRMLQRLLNIKDVDFYLLQKDISNEEKECISCYSHLHNLQSYLTDFGVTAGIIERLDLIITVDTAVAHLSGALGKPTWVLLAFCSDWRWLSNLEYSPWYPSIWLFRQPCLNNWENVVESVTSSLKNILSHQHPKPYFPNGVVTIPYFNTLSRRGGDVVLQTLRSVEESIAYFYSHYLQSWQVSIEVILVDDNSSDKTYNFLLDFTGYKSDYKCISVIKSKDEIGPGFARNQGISYSKAELLFFCDDDDCYLKEHIYTLFLFMNTPLPSIENYQGVINNSFISAAYTSITLENHIKANVHPYWIRGIAATIPITKCIHRRLHDFIGGFPTDVYCEDDVVYKIIIEHFASMIYIDKATVLFKHYPGNSLDRQLSKFSGLPGQVTLTREDTLREKSSSLAIQKSLNNKLLIIKGRNYMGSTKNAMKIAIGWGLGMDTGWGVFGTNLALQLLCHREFQPVLLSANSFGCGHYNPLTQKLLAPLLSEWYKFQQLLNQNPNRAFKLDIAVIHALGNNLVCPSRDKFIGEKNIGFIFFENSLFTEEDKERGKSYDLILAGSSWNTKILKQNNVQNVHTVLQGIDPTLFHPAPKSGLFTDRFVIFSGGKIEFRKGQDIVVAAYKRFYQRHPDALLVVAWHNFWSQFMLGMDQTGNVEGLPQKKNDKQELDISTWLNDNGLPSGSFYDVGLVPNYLMPLVYREADVALFPNRCEGGTNLVAMECLACGLPTILSANTGHLDLIDDSHCYPLTKQRSVSSHPIFPGTQDWGESDLEEVVEQLERVYTDREEAKKRGTMAAKFMETMTWQNQVKQLLRIIQAQRE